MAWRQFAQSARDQGRRVGLVPTMGALHDGHLSLVRRARHNGDVVVLTSFVNPRQFSDPRDLAKYPHAPEADAALAAFVTPTLREMWPDYPAPTLTTVSVTELGDRLEGETRPGHFDGVASVVAKLFTVTGPCRAYFGQKDYQQLVVVRRMVSDLAFDVEVVGCVTQRAVGIVRANNEPLCGAQSEGLDGRKHRCGRRLRRRRRRADAATPQ